jgi:fermentation-respiration switch protein FrsA (DUF1100 family)
MITPLQCAQQSARIYSDPTGWLHYWTFDDVVVGHVQVDGADVLALRGSVTIEDWMRDAAAIPVWHDKLGFVDAGFLAGMDDVFAEVRAAVGPKLTITGHSLGGARARILAGLFACAGIAVEQLTVFGSPKPAFANLARVIKKSGMLHASYRFFNDIVPTVPFTIAPCFDFVHTEDWIALAGHSGQSDLGPLRDHSVINYIDALS